MSDDDIKTRIAVTESKQKEIERRVSNLEGNQKWVVLAIFGALAKSIMDLLTWGSGQ